MSGTGTDRGPGPLNVSVIILHYGSSDHTLRSLRSVPATAETVIVDNQGDWLPANETRLVTPGENLGFSMGCNAGRGFATGDLLVFLNNDCFGQGNWLSRLVAPFADPVVGVVGARLLYPDGTLQHAGVYVDFQQPPGSEAGNRKTEQPAAGVDAVTGACLAIRADIFDRLCGFDPEFINGYEDVDLCLRVKGIGYRVHYEPTATLTHLESASGPERFAHAAQNIARLRQRWIS